MSALLDHIKQTVEQAIAHSTAYVLDPMNDGQHLQIIVVSSTFEGIPLVKQHKMVMEPLKEELKATIHALGVKTFTPQKWQESKSNFGF